MTSIANTIFRPPFDATYARGRLAFDISEPWYRSLPVSCLVGLDVMLDGQAISPERVTVEVDGVVRSLAQCAEAWTSFWFVQDPATVGVAIDHDPGRSCEIAAHLTLRIPYIMVGPTEALPRHVSERRFFEVVSR